MQRPSCAIASLCLTLFIAPTPTLARQAGNTGDADGSGLNTGGGGTRGVARVLSAPRLDPTTPAYRDSVVHWRTAIPPAMPGDDPTDFLESINVYSFGNGFFISELDGASDELGAPTLDSNNNGVPEVWGGAAYKWNPALATQVPVSNGSGTTIQSPYLRGAFIHSPEFNTFGGVTMNGGAVQGNARIAFFAGLIDGGTNPESSLTNRSEPPTNLMTTYDENAIGAKVIPLRRGIWSSIGAIDGIVGLRAIEDDSSRPAPPDPDSSQPSNDVFFRLHPSDYGLNTSDPLVGSLLAEQRFGRVSNMAMNSTGALAFRGDIGTSLNPKLGIWADQLDQLNQPTLHRVFIEEDGGNGLVMTHLASNDPAASYRIVSIGAPAFTGHISEPLVAAYAVLRGRNTDGSYREPVVAIIARQPGEDPNSNPLGGFTPKIFAIEGEPFNIAGSSDVYTFVNSILRTKTGFTRNPGLPGLADVAERIIDSGTHRNELFKNIEESRRSLSVFKPQPTINSNNEIAFVARVHTKNGQPITDTDPLSGDLLDEGIYTTRSASGSVEFVRLAFEGQAAPVIENGAALTTARFASLGEFFFEDWQTFHRPVINNKGDIVFLASWIDDPDGVPGSGDERGGRSLFLSRIGDPLLCIASSGDVYGAIEVPTYSDPSNPPDGTAPASVSMTRDFCRVPVPRGLSSIDDIAAYEQATISDCGIVTFTTGLEEVVSPSTRIFRGWALFSLNTHDPRPSLGQAALGPQLVLKSGTGNADGHETWTFPNMGPTIVVVGAQNAGFPEGLGYAFGDVEGGDATLHPDGSLVAAVNPDPDPGAPTNSSTGFLLLARQTEASRDYDTDGIVDGCDNCPTTPNANQLDADGNGVGDACEGGGPPGECENCLECIIIDCPFGGMLLGLGPDFDQSGVVDDTDLELMMMAMGLTKGRFDMNKDGVVGEKDLVMLLDDYGKTVETK